MVCFGRGGFYIKLTTEVAKEGILKIARNRLILFLTKLRMHES